MRGAYRLLYPAAVRNTAQALIYVMALAVWAMAPAWLAPSSTMVGDWMHPDCISNHWLLTWVSEQLADGSGIIHNDRYYWPVGDAPVIAGNGAEGILYLPFHLALGWPTGSVVYLTGILILGGMGGWALGRALGAGPTAALIPATAAILSPYVLSELSAGRFSQVSIGWMLFTLAAWLRLLDAPSRPRWLLAGGLWALTALFYWYYAWFVALALGLLLLAHSLAGRSIPWRAVAAGAGTAALLISPWAWLFLQSWSEIPGALETFPPPNAQLDSIFPSVPLLTTTAGDLGTMSAGLWLLGLLGAVVTLRRGDMRCRWALCTWVLFSVLAMGPFMAAAPYTVLYEQAAPLRRFWWPLRHVALAGVLWAGLGAVWLTGRRWGKPVAVAVVVSAPLLLAWDGAPHQILTTSLDLTPGGYSRLAAMEDGVALQPPLAPEAAGTQLPLLFQRIHKKRLLSGHALWVDRVRPKAWDARVEGNSYLRALMKMERGEAGEALTFDPQDLADLIDQGLRWFILDRSTLPYSLRDVVSAHRVAGDALFGRPVIRDRGLFVWDMSMWNQTSTVSIPAVRWPEDLPFAGPEHPLTAKRPPPSVIVLQSPTP